MSQAARLEQCRLVLLPTSCEVRAQVPKMDLFIHSQRFFHPRFHTARSSLQQTDQRRGNAARAGESSVGMCTGNARGRTVSAGVATAGRGLTVTSAEVVALMMVFCRLCCHSSGGVRALQQAATRGRSQKGASSKVVKR